MKEREEEGISKHPDSTLINMGYECVPLGPKDHFLSCEATYISPTPGSVCANARVRPRVSAKLFSGGIFK